MHLILPSTFVTPGSTHKPLQLSYSRQVPFFGILTIIPFFHSLGKISLFLSQNLQISGNVYKRWNFTRCQNRSEILRSPLQLLIIGDKKPSINVSQRTSKRFRVTYKLFRITVYFVSCVVALVFTFLTTAMSFMYFFHVLQLIPLFPVKVKRLVNEGPF